MVLGFAAGYLEAGTNTHVTLRHGARGMGMLHAGYGIGAALGPLLMTLLIAAGASWRWGFAVRRRPGRGGGADQPVDLGMDVISPVTSTADPRRSRRCPAVAWWTLGPVRPLHRFRGGAGQWAFTLFTEGRGLTAVVAGLAVTGFYGALTAARLLLTGLGDRVPGATTVDRLGRRRRRRHDGGLVVAGPVGRPGGAGGVRFRHRTDLPAADAADPAADRPGGTANMVGYQMAAASLGASLVPGLIGLLVGPFGVPVVAPVLVATGTAMVLVDLRLRTAAMSDRAHHPGAGRLELSRDRRHGRASAV